MQVTGSLSTATVAKGDDLRFFVTVRTPTNAAIFSVALKGPTAAGLDLASRCWCGSTDGACSDLCIRIRGAAGCITGHIEERAGHKTQPMPNPALPSSRHSLRRVRAWPYGATSTPPKQRTRRTVVAEVDWNDSAAPNPRTSNFAFPLGDAVIQSDFEQFRSSSFYDFLKDISLPFMLALLAFALAGYDKWREGKRSAASEERAHTLQTWDRMLPISHNLATRYYMPIEGAARAALGALDLREEAL